MKRKEDDMEKDYRSLTDEALDKLKESCVDDDLSVGSFAYRYIQQVLSVYGHEYWCSCLQET